MNGATVRGLSGPHSSGVPMESRNQGLEYFPDIKEDSSPSSFPFLDSVQNRAVRFIGDEALSSALDSLSCHREIPDLRLFHRYFHRTCSA